MTGPSLHPDGRGAAAQTHDTGLHSGAESLVRRFALRSDVRFEEIPRGREVIRARCATLVRADRASLDNHLAILIAMAKLSEEDPLLVTFFFPRKMTSIEASWARDFFTLCHPLRTAWIWKTLKTYAEDIHALETKRLARPSGDLLEAEDGGLAALAILSEHAAPSGRLPLEGSKVPGRDSWNAYIEALGRFARAEPEVALYLRLPSIIRAPYRVAIEGHAEGRLFSPSKTF